MTLVAYDPASTLLEARRRYFDANHFGPDGGYDEPWVDFKLGPIPMPFPNTPARVAAVKVHDLHHIITGYDTDLAGELEIAGFEIGAGCERFVAAWIINLAGVGVGSLVWPRRVFRAFVRGTRSHTLYGRPLDAMLTRTVGELRSEVGVDSVSDEPVSIADRARFAGIAVSGTLLALVLFVLLAPLMPLGVVALSLARRKHAA